MKIFIAKIINISSTKYLGRRENVYLPGIRPDTNVYCIVAVCANTSKSTHTKNYVFCKKLLTNHGVNEPTFLMVSLPD